MKSDERRLRGELAQAKAELSKAIAAFHWLSPNGRQQFGYNELIQVLKGRVESLEAELETVQQSLGVLGRLRRWLRG